MQLKRDKNVLMMELVRLRRQQEVSSQPTKVQRSCRPDPVTCPQRCCQRCAASFAGKAFFGGLPGPAGLAAWAHNWLPLSWWCTQAVLRSTRICAGLHPADL